MSNIAIIGLGYVGCALCACLSKRNAVIGVDKNPARVASVNKGDFSFLGDGFPKEIALDNLQATSSVKDAVKAAEAVFICVDTDFSQELGRFDVTSLDKAIEEAVAANGKAAIIIRSTAPIGYTKAKQEEHPDQPILFSPEFLKEDSAYYDVTHPTRIIVGGDERFSKQIFAICRLLEDSSENSPTVLTMTSIEAEAVKLFSNTYLALRVAYFNELDSLAMSLGADSKKIIEGVSLDPRIGDHYNRPSFGYGGYCLPKDSKQLLSSYSSVPQTLIDAVVTSNKARREYIVSDILARFPPSTHPTLGFYRLLAKKGSKSLRSSSSIELLNLLVGKGYRLLVYEPLMKDDSEGEYEIVSNLEAFKKESSLILADCYDEALDEVREKVYTRDSSRK